MTILMVQTSLGDRSSGWESRLTGTQNDGHCSCLFVAYFWLTQVKRYLLGAATKLELV